MKKAVCDACIWDQNDGCFMEDMRGIATECDDFLDVEQFLFDTEQEDE